MLCRVKQKVSKGFNRNGGEIIYEPATLTGKAIRNGCFFLTIILKAL
jgi:hypothetical protein